MLKLLVLSVIFGSGIIIATISTSFAPHILKKRVYFDFLFWSFWSHGWFALLLGTCDKVVYASGHVKLR